MRNSMYCTLSRSVMRAVYEAWLLAVTSGLFMMICRNKITQAPLHGQAAGRSYAAGPARPRPFEMVFGGRVRKVSPPLSLFLLVMAPPLRSWLLRTTTTTLARNVGFAQPLPIPDKGSATWTKLRLVCIMVFVPFCQIGCTTKVNQGYSCVCLKVFPCARLQGDLAVVVS